MAEPTPWPLANNNRKRRVRRIEHYVRDPYNFTWETVSNGTNPAIRIGAVGPHAAGAPNPSDIKIVESVEVITTGTLRDAIYGNNRGEPA